MPAANSAVVKPSDSNQGMAWRGRELFASKGWSFQLSNRERDTLRRFVERTAGQAPETISRLVPPTPDLTDLADRISDILERGTGVVLLRDFVSAEWQEHAVARAFWFLSLQLGTPVSQSAEGHR